ncbi:hypothetical protein BH10PLA1_BH10PLA1_10320 [soil metagenome]
MKHSHTRLAGFSLLALGLLCGIARAGDYTVKYVGPDLTVIIFFGGPEFTGEIHKGDQMFPMTAHTEGDHLAGTFTAGGNAFTFTATQSGDGLTFSTGGATYQLSRHANPLAGGNAAAAAAAPANGAADPLAAYTPLTINAVGRSLVLEVPAAKTTRDALQIAFPDLAQFFGARPNITGAYEDQRDHSSAFVSFTSRLNGLPVKGFVTVKMRQQGAVLFVVYGQARATRAEWAELTAAPAGMKDSRSMQEKMDEVPLTPYKFADGTGSIGVADGWTTKAQTESNLIITGPAGQRIRMAAGGTMYTPDNWIVRQNNGQQNLPVAQYSPDPATALANFTRANSEVSRRGGGITWTPDKLIDQKIINARNPGAHAAQVTYDLTINDTDGPKHQRVFCQFEVSPLMNGTWNLYIYLQLFAPQESFDKDLPTMMAQAFSLNEDPAKVAAKGERERNAAAARAKELQEANQKIADANMTRIRGAEDASARQSQKYRSDEENETIKLRSITDFDEVIRGVRTVEDTQSGKQTSVNLADVHDIVETLNLHDPGRFREIPLRDEVYPLAGQ